MILSSVLAGCQLQVERFHDFTPLLQRLGTRLAPSQDKPTAKDQIETIKRRLLARDPDVAALLFV